MADNTDATYTREQLETLKRKEIQALAKVHSIKANQKTTVIIDLLLAAWSTTSSSAPSVEASKEAVADDCDKENTDMTVSVASTTLVATSHAIDDDANGIHTVVEQVLEDAVDTGSKTETTSLPPTEDSGITDTGTRSHSALADALSGDGADAIATVVESQPMQQERHEQESETAPMAMAITPPLDSEEEDTAVDFGVGHLSDAREERETHTRESLAIGCNDQNQSDGIADTETGEEEEDADTEMSDSTPVEGGDNGEDADIGAAVDSAISSSTDATDAFEKKKNEAIEEVVEKWTTAPSQTEDSVSTVVTSVIVPTVDAMVGGVDEMVHEVVAEVVTAVVDDSDTTVSPQPVVDDNNVEEVNRNVVSMDCSDDTSVIESAVDCMSMELEHSTDIDTFDMDAIAEEKKGDSGDDTAVYYGHSRDDCEEEHVLLPAAIGALAALSEELPMETPTIEKTDTRLLSLSPVCEGDFEDETMTFNVNTRELDIRPFDASLRNDPQKPDVVTSGDSLETVAIGTQLTDIPGSNGSSVADEQCENAQESETCYTTPPCEDMSTPPVADLEAAGRSIQDAGDQMDAEMTEMSSAVTEDVTETTTSSSMNATDTKSTASETTWILENTLADKELLDIPKVHKAHSEMFSKKREVLERRNRVNAMWEALKTPAKAPFEALSLFSTGIHSRKKRVLNGVSAVDGEGDAETAATTDSSVEVNDGRQVSLELDKEMCEERYLLEREELVQAQTEFSQVCREYVAIVTPMKAKLMDRTHAKGEADVSDADFVDKQFAKGMKERGFVWSPRRSEWFDPKLEPKSQVKKSLTETSGVRKMPDFAAIHKAKFAVEENIEDYQKRVDSRRRRLLAYTPCLGQGIGQRSARGMRSRPQSGTPAVKNKRRSISMRSGRRPSTVTRPQTTLAGFRKAERGSADCKKKLFEPRAKAGRRPKRSLSSMTETDSQREAVSQQLDKRRKTQATASSNQ